MYVGGGNDNIILTYAEAFTLADEDKLRPEFRMLSQIMKRLGIA